MPCARSAAKPRPLTSGNGSSIAATTRRMPAAMIRSVQGPVRPVCDARFQRAVERGAAAPLACFVERVHLGVRLAGALVCAVADHDTFVGDHARADDRIRCRAPEAAPRLLERAPHPPASRFSTTTSPETARRRNPAPRTGSGRRCLRRRRRSGSAASDRARSRRRRRPSRCHRAW